MLILVGLVGAVVLWNKAKDAAWASANQKLLMRGAHLEGSDAVHTPMTFTTSATGAQILAKVEQFGWSTTRQSVLTSSVYIQHATECEVVFASGNRLGESFRSVLTNTATKTGTSGVYRVVAWTEGDGIVADIAQMKIIQDRLRSAITELDDAAVFATTPGTPANEA